MEILSVKVLSLHGQEWCEGIPQGRAKLMSLCSKNKRKAILGDTVSGPTSGWEGLSWLRRFREPVLSSRKIPFLHPGIDTRPGTGDSKNVVAKLLGETDVCSCTDNFLRSPL